MTMMDELYQQVILDHNRRPRHFYKPDKPTHKAEGFNPLCGDHYHVYLTLNRDGTIEEVAFEGAGCAISKASLSIMTEALQGKTPEEAKALFEQFHEVVMGHVDSESANSRSSPASQNSQRASNAQSWAGTPSWAHWIRARTRSRPSRAAGGKGKSLSLVGGWLVTG